MKTKYADSKRSEEVSDIVDRMPWQFGKWVAIAVVFFAVLLLIAGYIIKYPDTVAGQITLNSSQPPVKLVANTTGKLYLFHPKARNTVKQNEYIAIIQNSAHTDDIRHIIELMQMFRLSPDSLSTYKNFFPDKVSLGELDLKYFTFLSALKNICNYKEANNFEQQRVNLTEYVKWQDVLLRQTQDEIVTIQEKLNIAEKWYYRNAALYAKDMIPEIELDRIRNEYLSIKNTYQNLQKTVTSIHIQAADAKNRLSLLAIEQHEKESQLQLSLLSSFHDLTDNLKIWEQKYVFKAPFDGTVEFLRFWTTDEFVQAGEEIFSIIPRNTDVLGQMLLPAQGAGKVKEDSEVIIKLHNYPYMEFGSIEGRVSSISLVTQAQKTEKSSVETYLITVSLPYDLTTNYGEILNFQHELKGTADIIIKKRRLIERLFDNLKYRTK